MTNSRTIELESLVWSYSDVEDPDGMMDGTQECNASFLNQLLILGRISSRYYSGR